MKIFLYSSFLLFSVVLSAQEKDFEVTAKYIIDKVQRYSEPFDNGNKVASVKIEKDGAITFNYTGKNMNPYTFNIMYLEVISTDNQVINCKCGITISNKDMINFWISKEKAYGLKVAVAHAKPLYNAFVHLQTVINSEGDYNDIFADPVKK